MNRARAACAAGVVVLGMTAAVAGDGVSQANGLSPLERARHAAETTVYKGVLAIEWLDAKGTHATTLQIEGGNGVVRVEGTAKLAATPTQRWVFRNGDWDLMSPAGLANASVPLPDKYRWTSSSGPTVAGRPTELVAVTANGRLEERLFLDRETGLLLRRQQMDERGRQIRSVGFDAITVGTTAAPAKPDKSVDVRPAVATSVKAPYTAPAELPGGYRRVGVFRKAKTVQVVYSDGIHGLSMFEQPGRLDRDGIPPSGQPVAVGASNGFRYVYSGGQVVLWQSGGSTYTVVGDGTPADVLSAARAVPVIRKPSDSVTTRVRKLFRDIVRAVTAP